MLPKVSAALSFVREGGERAVIGSLEEAADAVRGLAGTQFLP
jgi:carbamate kinase